MGLLEGKTAVITGSNRGIGRKITEKFAQNGADVIACARSVNGQFETDMKELAEQLTYVMPDRCRML